MKKFLAVLGATLVMATSAFAGQAIFITNGGVVVYDNTKNAQDIRHYNTDAPLPDGYKRVCSKKFKKSDFRNKNCVPAPKIKVAKSSHVNERRAPTEMFNGR